LHTAGTPADDAAVSVAVDPSDKPIATGYFTDHPLQFGGLGPLVNLGQQDIFVVKYNANLTQPLWARRIGGIGQEGHSPDLPLGGIAVDLLGRIYVTSASQSGVLVAGTQSLVNTTGLFFARYETNGTLDFITGPTGGSGIAAGIDIAVHPSPTSQKFDTYVVGLFETSIQFGPDLLTWPHWESRELLAKWGRNDCW
jgi:hypothetical protein